MSKLHLGKMHFQFFERGSWPQIKVKEVHIPLSQFRIDASTANLDQNDIINVAGGFNNWCGNCHPMTNRGDGIWERKIELPSGNHEYQFVVNNWGGQISAPPAGSSCDFNPCDEYNNYGFLLNSFTEEWMTPIHCWNSCCSN